MQINWNFLIRRILPVAAGAALGYGYYYFIGCTTGTCPITSNPYISTAYGTFLGLIFAFPNKKKNEEASNAGNSKD